MGVVREYLAEVERAGRRLSEADLVARIASRIFGDLLGYRSDEWRINPKAGQEGAEGIPDLTVFSRHNGDQLEWLVAEAKLDDAEIRNETSRNQLWADKRKYVTGETVYFLWLAPRTILVCDPTGQVRCGVYMEPHALEVEANGILSTVDDAAVRDALALIAAEQAHSLRFLEAFREGCEPARYLSVTRDTVGELTRTLRGCVASLRSYCARRWAQLESRYEEYKEACVKLQDYFDVCGSDLPEHEARLKTATLKERYADVRKLFEIAYPTFCREQSYTRWEPEREDQKEEEALREIFFTNAAYVVLGRLLFVRFAEDHVDAEGRPLLPRKISNGGLRLWRQLVGTEQSFIGKLVDLAFCQAGSVFRQIFAETVFDALFSLDDPEFDLVLLSVLRRLNAFDFQKLDRDLLGDLYQKLLPRDLRKRLGEFYTDQEVVDYILHRTGFVEAARKGTPTILDPACGSGTFLVRAAVYLIEGARSRGVSDDEILRQVCTCIHGLDINDFAVFITRMNLLFTVFDLVARARRDVAFQVYEANSLAESPLPLPDARVGSTVAAAALSITPGAEVRSGQYDFVVGNPPYVRAERLPEHDRASLQQRYAQVSERNTDLAVYFVYRGREWLRDGGTFGMIVPRAVADAAHATRLRTLLGNQGVTVTEIVPLDWACHELFDSDNVPMILIFRRERRPGRHSVNLVHGLRSLVDLDLAARSGRRAQRVSWADFQRVADDSGELIWPLELTKDDVKVFDALQSLRCQGRPIRARFGVKLGAGVRAADVPGPESAPLLRGSDVYAYALAPPSRFADLSRAVDRSLWACAHWDDRHQLFAAPEGQLPSRVAATAKIGVTLNATVLDPRVAAAQDTIVLASWNGLNAPVEALVCLLNSSLLRWYAFVFLRAGVAGGGRRDYTIYPRTLEALPVPGAADKQWAELASIARQASLQAQAAAPLDDELWASGLADLCHSRLSEWPIVWHEWPDDARLTDKNFSPLFEDRRRLRLSRKIVLVSDNRSVLEFLQHHLRVALKGTGKLTKSDAQRLPAPDPRVVRETLAKYANAVAARDQARASYLEVVAQADEAVFGAFGLPDSLRQIVRRRMSEFPLSEHAANFRKPWEPTRKPAIKIFEPGRRFK